MSALESEVVRGQSEKAALERQLVEARQSSALKEAGEADRLRRKVRHTRGMSKRCRFLTPCINSRLSCTRSCLSLHGLWLPSRMKRYGYGCNCLRSSKVLTSYSQPFVLVVVDLNALLCTSFAFVPCSKNARPRNSNWLRLRQLRKAICSAQPARTSVN